MDKRGSDYYNVWEPKLRTGAWWIEKIKEEYMKQMKKKTERRLSKLMRKLVKKYGEAAVVALVTKAATAEVAKSTHTSVEQTKSHKKGKKQIAASPSMASV